MSVHVLLNLLNELRKRDKIRGLPSILSLFRNEFNKFNNILKPTANWSPYIFTLVQKVKRRVYKIHFFF